MGTRTAVLLCALAAAAKGETRLKGRPVVAEAPFFTQRTDLRPYRPVGDAIRVGGDAFPVAAGRNTLKVATKSGGKPSKTARRGGTTLTLAGGRHVHVRLGAVWEVAVVDALAFELDRTEFRLLDFDGDGTHDAYRVLPHPFVLPLPEALVLGRQSVSIVGVEGRTLTAVVTPLRGSRHQLDGLAAINDLRLGVGLPPTVLDPELSAACSAHANYLLKNKWTPATNPHFEIKGRRGYTEAGHRAGMMSVIAWSDHAGAVPGHWITYYHRFAFQHPVLRGVGISDGTPSISIIDGKSGTTWEARAWRDPMLVPADGSVDVPAGFHRGGEMPAPVENAGSRGFPLTVLFLTARPGVSDFRGELVRLSRRREEPVATLVPDGRRSPNRFGLIPERPLRSGSRYRVIYRFRRDGRDETAAATFAVK